jgi:hypothetical protein
VSAVEFEVFAAGDARGEFAGEADRDARVVGVADDQRRSGDLREQVADVDADVEVEVAQGALVGDHRGVHRGHGGRVERSEERGAERGHGRERAEAFGVVGEGAPQPEGLLEGRVVAAGPAGDGGDAGDEVGPQAGEGGDDGAAQGEPGHVDRSVAGGFDDGGDLGGEAFDGERRAVVLGLEGTGELGEDDGVVRGEVVEEVAPDHLGAAGAGAVDEDQAGPGAVDAVVDAGGADGDNGHGMLPIK